jgi:hypothetical protein
VVAGGVRQRLAAPGHALLLLLQHQLLQPLLLHARSQEWVVRQMQRS